MTKEMILTLFDFRFNKEVGFKPLMNAIQDLTAEQASWRPSEQTHSIWQIVNHLIFWNTRLLNQLQEQPQQDISVDNIETFKMPVEPSENSWQEVINEVHLTFKNLSNAVERLDSSKLDKQTDADGNQLKVVLIDMAMHDSYHIGQILYIRKLQGITK